MVNKWIDGVEQWWTRKLTGLGKLEDGWDGYGSKCPQQTAFTVATMFLYDLEKNGVSRPEIVPTSQGGIQLELHKGGFDLEIEIGPTGHTEFFLSYTDILAEGVSEYIPQELKQ